MRGGLGRVGDAFSSPTCLKPRISVQNWWDSSRLRTFSTKWFRPDGVTGPMGAAWFPDILSSCLFGGILDATLARWCRVRRWARKTSEYSRSQTARQRSAQVAAAADVVRTDVLGGQD